MYNYEVPIKPMIPAFVIALSLAFPNATLAGKITPAVISAFSSEVNQTDDSPTITASGQETRDGIVACPRKYPFGTAVQIAGIWYECTDRMNSRYETKELEHFDIYMPATKDAITWGRQKQKVIVISTKEAIEK